MARLTTETVRDGVIVVSVGRKSSGDFLEGMRKRGELNSSLRSGGDCKSPRGAGGVPKKEGARWLWTAVSGAGGPDIEVGNEGRPDPDRRGPGIRETAETTRGVVGQDEAVGTQKRGPSEGRI